MNDFDKKGITVKVPSPLHAEVKEFIEKNGLTMSEFVEAALDEKLHPTIIQSEENTNMEKTRTMAFQVPEDLFFRVKDYLHENNISQKDFMIGLIETELDRDIAEKQTNDATEDEFEGESEEIEETAENEEFEGVSDETEDEDEELTEETTVYDDEDCEYTDEDESEEEELSEEQEAPAFSMAM